MPSEIRMDAEHLPWGRPAAQARHMKGGPAGSMRPKVGREAASSARMGSEDNNAEEPARQRLLRGPPCVVQARQMVFAVTSLSVDPGKRALPKAAMELRGGGIDTQAPSSQSLIPDPTPAHFLAV